MGQTIAEKILSRQNAAGKPVKAGDLIDADLNGLLVLWWPAIRNVYRKIGFKNGPPTVWDRDRTYLMLDHYQPPVDEPYARGNLEARRDAARLGLKHFYDSEMGISHHMMMDYGHVRPGELLVGNDSHVICFGALNAAATGIGNDEEAFALAFGRLFFSVPQTIKIVLRGKNKSYPIGKDIILYLAGKYGDSFAQNLSMEFTGPLAGDMDLTTRMTLADHAVELGAKFGLFLADDKTLEFVKARTDQPFETTAPDPDAQYVQTIELDCDAIGPQVAKPFRFDNVSPVQEVSGIKIDQARIGSCANGRFEDIEIAARMLKGRKVARGVRFYISPASMAVYRQCAEAGLVADLISAGAQFQNPGCTICGRQIVLNEEVCISSTTRNSRGRMGGPSCSDAKIYLAGPATVTAAAIAGKIVDPREFLND